MWTAFPTQDGVSHCRQRISSSTGFSVGVETNPGKGDMITSITCPLSSVQVIQQIKSLQQAQNKSATNQSCSPNIYKQKLFVPLMHNANMFIIIIINYYYYHRWTHSPYYVQRMQERALYVFNVTKNTLAIILPRSTK